MYEEMMDFMERTAREAGAVLRDRVYALHDVQYKGEINLVTEADRLSEKLIVRRIRESFPQHGILAEESPEMATSSGFRWIIDPLDGTTNYAHGYPVFAVSIALEMDGTVILGAVFNPMSEEYFMAAKGRGAFLNGRPLRVSTTDSLKHSLLATGFPYDIRTDRNNNFNYFKSMALNAQAIRRAGSAALDLAFVAAGRFDGFWELKLAPWDTAAGWLILEEAGGVVTDLAGGVYQVHSPNILATNGRIHKEMLRIISGTDPIDKA